MTQTRYTPEDVVRLRERLGLTQEDLAGLLSCSQATVSKWERGELTPGIGPRASFALLAEAEQTARGAFRALVEDLYRYLRFRAGRDGASAQSKELQ